jgi:hypothetical protein
MVPESSHCDPGSSCSDSDFCFEPDFGDFEEEWPKDVDDDALRVVYILVNEELPHRISLDLG